MKSSKLFFIFFISGLLCLLFAGLNLFVSLNPSVLRPKVQYELGLIDSTKGSVKRMLKLSQKESAKKSDKVYSKETYTLKKNASLSMTLADEKITVLGPAKFSLSVVSPESKKLFINFSEFNKVDSKEGLKNITLTYKGWVIESYFSKEDLVDTSNQEIKSLTSSNEEGADEEEKGMSADNKEAMLDEMIAAKRTLLKKCYENYLRQNPMATGKLVVEFQLKDTGRVSASRVKDSSFFKDESFKSCIQDVFLRIQTKPFQVEGGHIKVTYPIEFE